MSSRLNYAKSEQRKHNWNLAISVNNTYINRAIKENQKRKLHMAIANITNIIMNG